MATTANATTTGEWDKAKAIKVLETCNRMQLYRMLHALYLRQTWAEQASQTTKEHNGAGFNAFDAEFLSSVAEKAEKYQTLTEGQARVVRRRLRKYASQLADIANQNLSERRRCQDEQ